MSAVTKISLCSIMVCAPMLFPQTPAQPGTLVIKSTPVGAKITVKDTSGNVKVAGQLTDANFVVAPGKYVVSVIGGPGNLNCPEKEVEVFSGQAKEVHCTGTEWSQ